MTIKQAERFYEQDRKDYDIKKNKDFLNWLKDSIANGYYCYLKIDELQELIDYIVRWYEVRYPERELEYYDGFRQMGFDDIRSISNVMDIKQLLFRLPDKQLYLMKSGYRARAGGQKFIYENGKIVGSKPYISMRINRKNYREDEYTYDPYFLISAEYMTGKVLNNYELEKYLDIKKDLYLDELLDIFNKKYNDLLDLTELKRCIYNHSCDIELRKRILQLVALKLLYSRNTSPNRGYQRAQRFINEFNKKMNLTLSTTQIDEIIKKDYTNDEKWEPDFEDKEKEETSRIIKLARRMFNKYR